MGVARLEGSLDVAYDHRFIVERWIGNGLIVGRRLKPGVVRRRLKR